MKQILLLVFLGIATCLSAQIDLTGNLLFYYQLENNVDDASPKGNNGTANNVTYATGKFDKGADFDGVGGYIQSPAAMINPATENLTIAAWVYIRSFTDKTVGGTGLDKPKMVCQMQDGTGKGRSFIYVDPVGNLMKSFLGGSTVSGSDSIVENEWAHLALVVTSAESKATLYYNGTMIADSVTKNPIEACDGEFNFGVHKIGADSSINLPDRLFDGYMDEIALLNKALSADEVNSLMQHGAMHGTNVRYVSSNQNIVKIGSALNGVLNINLDEEFTTNSAELNIYDVSGRKLFTRSILKGDNVVDTDLREGLYVLTINSDIKTYSTSVFVK